jgi:hypothetical protein
MTLASASLLGGCKSRREAEYDKAAAAIKDGSAKAALQHYFDSHRQCAHVLAGADNGKDMMAEADNRVAQALVTAGLIVESSAKPALGEGKNARLYEPAPSARQWFTPPTATDDRFSLCYARREIRSAWLNPDVKFPQLRYSYALVDPAPWAASGPVRKAVPTMAAALAGFEIYSQDSFITFKDGKPVLDQMYRTDQDPVLFQFGVEFTDAGIPAEN